MRISLAIFVLLAGLNSFAVGMPNIDQVASAISFDIDKDGKPDNAFLTLNPGSESFDLYVKLSSTNSFVIAKEFSHAVNLGPMVGSGNEIDKNEVGSLVVRAYNDALGRYRWQEEITIAFRNGSLQVAGYTYQARDTIDPDNFSKCDVNALTGIGKIIKGNKKGKFSFVEVQPIPVENTNSTKLHTLFVDEGCDTMDVFENDQG